MAQSTGEKRDVTLPDRLKAKLRQIAAYPLTLVSAPMGYGKTTAVKAYLSGPDGGDWESPPTVLWQHLYGSGVPDFWEDFSAAFEAADPSFSGALREIPLPADSAGQRAFLRLFRRFCLQKPEPVVLVLDCVKLDGYQEIRDFLHFFVQSLPENFHLILIGRSRDLKNDDFFRIYGLVNSITFEDFEFSCKDIERYFKLYGISLSPSEVQHLYALSSGWIAVIHMNLLEYLEDGVFLPEYEIFRILERTFFAPLPEQTKEFLSAVSIAESFSMEQAEYLWGKGGAGTLLGELIEEGFCIAGRRTEGRYQLSPAFAAYFAEQNRRLPEEERNRRLNRLAEWYLLSDENALARRLYHRIKNFDALMDAVEKRRFIVLYGLDEQEFMSYYTDCPPEIRARHPIAVLTFARQMFALGRNEMGKEVCAEFENIMKMNRELSDETRSQLTGTYELLLCYAQYNDLTQMLLHINRAKELLDNRRVAIPWPDTGLNDSLSLLYMYHREPGALRREVAMFLEYNPYYSYLINGRLDGADLVMQAEALYVVGDLQGAEIALHKALLAVHQDKQWHTWLCTVMLQLRIALMKGDWHTIEHLLAETRESVSRINEYRILPATDILEIFLYSKLEQPQKIGFEFDADVMDRFTLCPRAAPMLYCIQAEGLLAKGEAVQLLAFSERYLESARVYPNVYAELVLHIEIAGAYEALSEPEQAKEHLKAALLLARPDRIIVPFVELSRYIRGSLPSMAQEGFAGEVEEIQRRGKAYAQSLRSIVTGHFSEAANTLTGREMEIAKLAAMRLSNKEIADRLVISESTVKTQLARAFSKLNIQKRRDLNRFFPEQ